jgi:hypothetical protein
MIRLVTITVVAGSLTTGAVAGDELLSHGSPAPKFEAGSFIRGPALAGLLPGTVYVIEFSGTQCAPCIESIPHLEELHRAYKEVVFVSVFSEPADDVRRFLDGPGQGITLRVVCDPDQSLWESWSVAAAQPGIPHVFVVDGAGKVAWIGPPGDLDKPLARVVAGKPIEAVDGVEEMNRRIEQRVAWLRRRVSEREIQAEEENRTRVTALIQRGELERATHALDQLIATYHDLPNTVQTFRARKLFVLGLVPGRGKEAFSLALELAVDARLSGSPTVDAAANSIMNHYEKCLPENRDDRMLHLALALLDDPAIPGEESVRSLNMRSSHFQAVARAWEFRGERARVSAALRQAIAAEEKVYERLRAEEYADEDVQAQRMRIDRLKERVDKHERK